jgi:hypothetical protein
MQQQRQREGGSWRYGDGGQTEKDRKRKEEGSVRYLVVVNTVYIALATYYPRLLYDCIYKER